RSAILWKPPAHSPEENMVRQKCSGIRRSYLVGYTKMTPKVRGVLNDVGFSISEEGKHYKITYHGDPRYTYILPKTGSDYRGALNAYSDISKKVFS
ncbi:hypothetical protein AB8T91_28055, partial [Klebsiella pneumoniae]